MKIRIHRSYLSGLESVAMTDIVLNMFIFFFISFSLLYTFDPNRLQRIEVNLPKAASGVSVEQKERFYVTLTEAGKIYVDKDAVNLNDLKSRLSTRFKEDKNLNVIIRVDKKAIFDRVTEVLDAVNQVGIKQISIAVTKK